jgi:hypothetical protein
MCDYRYSKEASGLPSFGDSAENGLQQLVQQCPGAQQIIAQGLKKDVPPAKAIQGLIETHFMVIEGCQDDNGDVLDADKRESRRLVMHLRLTNDHGNAKFQTKWNFLDSLTAPESIEHTPSHGHMLTSVMVNDARNSAQILVQRFRKCNDTLRFYSTNVLRFYPTARDSAPQCMCCMTRITHGPTPAHIDMHTYKHAKICLCAYLRILTCMHACMCVCVSVSVFVSMSVLCACMHTNVHIKSDV